MPGLLHQSDLSGGFPESGDSPIHTDPVRGALDTKVPGLGSLRYFDAFPV